MDVQDGELSTKVLKYLQLKDYSFFWFLIYIPNNGLMTLAKLIASVVKRFNDNKTTVFSVCTDNAKTTYLR